MGDTRWQGVPRRAQQRVGVYGAGQIQFVRGPLLPGRVWSAEEPAGEATSCGFLVGEHADVPAWEEPPRPRRPPHGAQNAEGVR